MSIDRLPDELLSRIFTVGADDEDETSDMSVKQKLKHGQQFPKAFTRTVAPVCHRWNTSIKDRANAHLWVVVARITLGNVSFADEDSCIALVKFRDLINDIDSGRRDIYAQLWSYTSGRFSTSRYRNDVRLFILAIKFLAPHQRRVASLDILFWSEHSLDVLMEIALHQFIDCPRLHSLKLQTIRQVDAISNDFFNVKQLHLPSTNLQRTSLSLTSFKYLSLPTTEVFQSLKCFVISPFLREIMLPGLVESLTWVELLALFDKCPNLKVFAGGLPVTSKPTNLQSTKSLKLKKVKLSSDAALILVFLRIFYMPLLEDLMIRTSLHPNDLMLEHIGPPLYMPCLKTVAHYSGRIATNTKFIASLALFPPLRRLELDYLLPGTSGPWLNVLTTPSTLYTTSLIIKYVYQIHSIPEHFAQIDFEALEDLDISIQTNDPFINNPKIDRIHEALQLKKLRTLKIRIALGTTFKCFLKTAELLRSPSLETVTCYGHETSGLAYAQLSFVKPPSESNSILECSLIESMIIHLKPGPGGGLRFTDYDADRHLNLIPLSNVKNITIGLGLKPRSLNGKKAVFQALAEIVGVEPNINPPVSPLPALEEVRIIVMGEGSQHVRFLPIARQMVDDLEIMRSRIAIKATRFIVETGD